MFPGFLIGFMPFFSDFTQFSIDWSVRTALYVSRGLFSWEATFLKKKTLSKLCFTFLGRKFSGFRHNYSSTVIRTALVSRFFNRIFANFFSDFTQVFFGWSVRTPLYASTALFPWEATSLIKNIFQIVFHILSGKFSGFRQKFSSTKIRTALVSRFFNLIYPKCFFWTPRKFFLTGLSELHSTCPENCFHGKHLL